MYPARVPHRASFCAWVRGTRGRARRDRIACPQARAAPGARRAPRRVSPRPDPALVAACLDGEAAAWSELLGRYADLVYGLARQCGLDDARAQDVVQEVSLALWRGLPRLRAAERLLPWVLTTTRREAWRLARRGRAARRREEDVARPEADPAPPSAGSLERLEEEQAVREALAALEERCRRLLRALYFEPVGAQGYDALAEHLGIPRGSIGPTRGRCLAKLREHLEVLGLGPGPEDGPAGGDVSGPAGSGSPPRRRRTP